MKVLRAAAGLLLTVLPVAGQGDCPGSAPCAEGDSHALLDARSEDPSAADGW